MRHDPHPAGRCRDGDFGARYQRQAHLTGLRVTRQDVGAGHGLLAGKLGVETKNAPEGASLMAVWRPRSDCLTNLLSFQAPYFWWGRGFELTSSPDRT